MYQNKLQKNIENSAQKSFAGQLRHGHIFSPASRAYFAWQENKLDEGQLNQCESGKFFPATEAGLTDSFAKDDSPNNPPPADGKIASGNQTGMEFLDAAGSQWQKHNVKSNEQFKITWAFTANHVTRRFNYFITKADWNPEEVLSREQFESTPLHTEQYEFQPFWQFTSELKPENPTNHTFALPNREGYHVLLAIWEVADTGNAFYQVIDLNFSSEGAGNQRPSTPTGFKVSETSEKSASFSWDANPTTDALPVKSYKIFRDGKAIIDVDGSTLTFTDTNVISGKTYSYYICAIDTSGNSSLPSTSIEVTIPSDGSGHTPPTAPQNLHTMSVTSDSADLMWGESNSETTIKQYHIYRDGLVVKTTKELNFKDTKLKSETKYQYFVAAETTSGEFSIPSNVLFITTAKEESSSQEWALNAVYKVNDLVSFNNHSYRCIQAHTSNIGWTPELAFTLWSLIS